MAPVNPEAQISHMEHTWSRAQGLAEDVRYYGEWMKEEAQWDCFSNQNITSREFSHVLRLCVESVFATIRGMVP